VSAGDGRDPRPGTAVARDYQGRVLLDYAPELDGDPDPGEIVWGWVPYEEDPSLGKDRPMVVIGRVDDGSAAVVALMLSSHDHDGDPGWVHLGTGAWDVERRESWVRTDRLFAVPPDGIRKEGAVLAKDRFLRLVTDLARRG
jgi:PemK-like, MazF-like toxin of type II toxin-antitoxin system